MVSCDKSLHVVQHGLFVFTEALRTIATLVRPNAGAPSSGVKPHTDVPVSHSLSASHSSPFGVSEATKQYC